MPDDIYQLRAALAAVTAERDELRETVRLWERLTARPSHYVVSVRGNYWTIFWDYNPTTGRAWWAVRPCGEDWTRDKHFDSPMQALRAIEEFEKLMEKQQ